eukprot:PhF_6_TR12555/c0_g1_i1/m.19676
MSHNLSFNVQRGDVIPTKTKSGTPFPSYSDGPTKTFPARWTQISNVKLPVAGLRCPRVRLNPSELETNATRLEALQKIGESETKQLEIPELNLSYQNLGDPYQYAALKTALLLNSRVHVLCLNNNELSTLREGIDLPCVTELHLSHNAFCSFDELPDVLPNLKTLHISNNFIGTLHGLTESRFPKLQVLTLKGNPVCRMDEFRKEVKSAHSKLKWLDSMML